MFIFFILQQCLSGGRVRPVKALRAGGFLSRYWCHLTWGRPQFCLLLILILSYSIPAQRDSTASSLSPPPHLAAQPTHMLCWVHSSDGLTTLQIWGRESPHINIHKILILDKWQQSDRKVWVPSTIIVLLAFMP